LPGTSRHFKWWNGVRTNVSRTISVLVISKLNLDIVQITKITADDGQIPDHISQQEEYSHTVHLTVLGGRNKIFLSNNKFPKSMRDTNIKIT
jgi:hypothetical protein